MNFIASMRMLLGKIAGSNDIMEKLIIDNLIKPARMISMSGDVDQDEIIDNIEAFEKLIHTEWFDKKVNDAAEFSLRTHPELSKDITVEYLVSEVNTKLLDGGWKLFEEHFDPQNMNSVEFMKYFSMLVYNAIRDAAEKMATYRKKFEHSPKSINDDEKEEVVEQVFTNPDSHDDAVEELQKGLLKYIASKDPEGKNGIYYAFMLVWLDKTLGQEVDRVEMKKIFSSPIIQHIAEQEAMLERDLERAFSQLKLWVFDYIQKVRKIRITDRFKRYHKVASELGAKIKRVAEMILGTDEFITPEEELDAIREEMKEKE